MEGGREISGVENGVEHSRGTSLSTTVAGQGGGTGGMASSYRGGRGLAAAAGPLESVARALADAHGRGRGVLRCCFRV